MKNLNGDLSREGFDLLNLRAFENPRKPELKRMPIRTDVIRWMPIGRKARFVVLIDGRPYAGFELKGDAVEAMTMWRQSWDAVVGKSMEVVTWCGA